MPRLTIINRRPGSFTIGDPTGYTNFRMTVGANSEMSAEVDGRVILAIEKLLVTSRDVGDIFFSVENQVETVSDDVKLSVLEVDGSVSRHLIPPNVDVVLIGTPSGSPASSIQIVLPAPGAVRDGHNVEVRDGVGLADTTPVTVYAGLYQLDLDTDLSDFIAEGDIIVISGDGASPSRDGSYPVFSTGNGGPGSYLVNLLSALPGTAAASSAATVSVLSVDGSVKLAPTSVTAVTRAPYYINESTSAYSIGSTEFCGANFILRTTFGKWSAVQQAASSGGAGAFTTVTASTQVTTPVVQPAGSTAPLSLSAAPTNSGGVVAVRTASATTLTQAGAGINELSNNAAPGSVGNWINGVVSGGQSDALCDCMVLSASGTIADGDVLVWGNTKLTVVRSPASAAAKNIAGVAVGSVFSSKIRVARRGLVYTNCENGISGAGTMVGSSGSTAGRADSLLDTNVGGLLGRTVEVAGATVANKVLIDLALG